MRFFVPLVPIGRALVAIAFPACNSSHLFLHRSKIQPDMTDSGVIRPLAVTKKSAGRGCPIRTVSVW